jgi:5'-3' exonuclease
MSEGNTNKINLILDFNNFAMRSMFTCNFMDPTIKINNFDTDEECRMLVEKILLDMCKVVRMFSPKRVIVSCDSKLPWRNDLYKDIDGETYKGTRIKDEKKNWKKIYATLDELRDILKDKGFIVTLIDRTEADDITTMWKEYLFSVGEDVVIVSSDMDWVQLVGMNQTGNVCVCFNPIANNKGRKHLYMDESIQEWLSQKDTTDIFFRNYNLTRATINKLPSIDVKVDFDVVDPKKVLLNKIMAGDRSDNVPAFWHYYRNGKKQSVTELKASHVFESLGISTLDDLIKANDDRLLKDALEKEMKQDIDLDFKERMDRQRKLVELNSSLFPKNIVKAFAGMVDDAMNQCSVNTASVRSDEILNGTKYAIKKAPEGRLNSVFDDIDMLGKFSSPSNKLFD